MIVPAKHVIAAKTSLFHECNSAKCAISSVVRLKVRAIANLTPRIKRSLGDAPVEAFLFVVFRVNKCLIQSAMVPQPLLPQAASQTGFFAFHFLIYHEAVQQYSGFFRVNVSFGYDGGLCGPWYRHCRVVNVI